MSIYTEIGLKRVVNASGRVTVLGVSTFSDRVAEAACEGGQFYVVIEDLMTRAGELISKHTGARQVAPRPARRQPLPLPRPHWFLVVVTRT